MGKKTLLFWRSPYPASSTVFYRNQGKSYTLVLIIVSEKNPDNDVQQSLICSPETMSNLEEEHHEWFTKL